MTRFRTTCRRTTTSSRPTTTAHLCRRPQIWLLGRNRRNLEAGAEGVLRDSWQEARPSISPTIQRHDGVRQRGPFRSRRGLLSAHQDRVVHVERAEPESPDSKNLANVLQMEGTISSGYPQAGSVPAYREAVYTEFCPRCGIYSPQKAALSLQEINQGPAEGVYESELGGGCLLCCS